MSLCANCHAGCCRSFAVPVTGADILRISSQLGLSFWDFACRWADPRGIIARNHAPHFYFADEPQTPFVICLMHEESAYFPKTDRCQFLQETGPTSEHPLGLAQCGIYDQRPAACRAFPAKLNHTSELAIIYDVPATGRAGGDPIYDLCPRQWTPADVDPVQTVQDLVVAKYEMNFFHRLADTWNQHPGHWSKFPEFVQIVYENRVRPADEAREETVDATEEVRYPRIAA